MRILKRVAIVFAVVLILLIGAAAAIPYFFKDELVIALKEKINETVNAKVDFEDVDISLFRSFPDLSMKISNFSVIGKDQFEGIQLAGGEAFGLDLDLMSVIKNENIEINAVDLVKPNLHVIVMRDGSANYDITAPTEPTPETTESTDFLISLESYSIEDGNIIYDDRTMPVYVDLKGLNHKGSGNFTSEVFDLITTTNIGKFTVDYDGTAYLIEASTDLEAIFNIDTKNSKYVLKDNDLKVNDLQLKADGFVQMAGDDINMDMTFSAPQNQFKNLFSLIPHAYIADYDDVKINGSFALDGMAKGTFNAEKEQYPSFKLNLGIKDGDVKYPDLPMGIKDIAANMLVYSPTSNLDEMTVDISRFNIKVGNNPFGGTFKLRTPLSDPDIDTQVKGVINLGDMAKAFPIEGVKTLNGIINADVKAKTKMSTIDSGDYANVNMSGNASVQDMTYDATGMPVVKVNTLQMDFNPQNVSIDKFEGKLGQSDIYAEGKIDNVLAYFSPKNTMKGSFTMRSNYFNADEWMTTSEPTTSDAALGSTTTATAAPAEETAPFENFNFDMDVNMGKIDYDIYQLKNLQTKANISSNKMTIDNFQTELNGSDIQASGVIDNILNFVYYNEGITGDINFSSNYMNMDKLMGEETATTTTTSTDATATSEVPDMRFDFDIKGNIKKLDYDIYTLSDMKADAKITEKKIVANSFRTNIGKSDISGIGIINNYMEYVFKNELIDGELNLKSRFMDLNELMAVDPGAAAAAATTTTSTEDVEPFLVPANMKFDINAEMDEILYTNIPLRFFKGTLKLADEAVVMENVSANTLGGKVEIGGGYNTKDHDNPKFDMKFDVANMDFQESFNKLNTFQAAAPIGKFIKGNYNTTLTMSGLLDKDMMPRLSTLSSDGFMQTLNGIIQGFPALKAVGDKLGVDAFDKMEIKNTKNWFSIVDGKVEVKPFDYAFKGIDMNIGGWHGLEADMDYDIKAKIPRDLMGDGAVGAAASKGLNFLSGQASKLGVNIADGEFINVLINLKGSMTKPKIDIKLLGAEGKRSVKEEVTASIKEEVDKAKDKAKEEAQKKIDEAKAKAEAEAQKKIDEAKAKAKEETQKKIDEAKKKLEEKIKKEAADKAEAEAKKKLEEALGKEKTDELKDKLDKFNPFGKKNKDKDKDKDKKEGGGGN